MLVLAVFGLNWSFWSFVNVYTFRGRAGDTAPDDNQIEFM